MSFPRWKSRQLLTAWVGLPALRDMQIRGNQTLSAEGEFQLDEFNVPQIPNDRPRPL